MVMGGGGGGEGRVVDGLDGLIPIGEFLARGVH